MFYNNKVRLYQYRKELGFYKIKKAIKLCHKLVRGHKVRREQSIEYAICTAFGKALTTFEEIILLLANGYPGGAFAITRTLYENYIIALFLNKHYKDHEDLLEKYFDAYVTHEVKYEKISYESILSLIDETRCHNNNARNLKAQINKEIQRYNRKIEVLKEKYPSARFQKDYWWVDGIISDLSFDGIQRDVGHPLLKAHYKFACSRVHSSFYSNVNKPGVDSDDIIYSATFIGYERPLAFSLRIFCRFVALFAKITRLKTNRIVAKLNPYFAKFKNYFFGIG